MCTWERRHVAYIVMWKKPRSQEYREFPYREKVELMSSRSWGYSSFQEGENCVVGSLCVVRKMFPYKNMRVDYVRPRRTCQYASPSIKIICQPSKEMHSSTSNGFVHVVIVLLQEQGTRSQSDSFEIDDSFRANGSFKAVSFCWYDTFSLTGLSFKDLDLITEIALLVSPTPQFRRLFLIGLKVIRVFMGINCVINRVGSFYNEC